MRSVYNLREGINDDDYWLYTISSLGTVHTVSSSRKNEEALLESERQNKQPLVKVNRGQSCHYRPGESLV